MRTENSSFRSEISVWWVLIAIICLTVSPVSQAPGENKKAWQAGTVLQVKAHEDTSGKQEAPKQYDVSIKVGKKIYSAVHTLKEGEPDLDWGNYVGMSRMVLIEGNTLTYRDLLGQPHTLKIVGSKDAPVAKAK